MTVNVVPRPSWLSTSMVPPAARTMSSVVERPSPVPKPGRLGGEERLEDAGAGGGVHARAGVGHRQHERARRRIGAGGDRDLAARGHRVACVHHQVEHGLLDAVGVGDDGGGVGGEVELERDRGAEHLVEELLHVVEPLVHVERLGFVALTAERHEVVGERGGAVGGALHRVDARPRRLEHLEVVLQQLDLTAHDRQHVVEVVGDAARETCHRLHLLRLEELLAEVGALGDVAQHDDLQRDGDVAAPQR